MLKKAGIIAAVAAAGVLGVSSLAFADTEKGNLGNDCTFGNASGAASSEIFGGDSLLGTVGGVITGLTTNAATQANDLNCTNVNTSDLFDQDSNNETDSVMETEIEDSYNS